MSLKVHTVKRKVLLGKNAGKEMFFGQVRLGEVVSLDKFSRQISANTTATPTDVEAVVNAMVHILTDELEEGNSIDLGDLGSMRVSARSKGAETKEKFHCRMMSKAKIIFTPGKLLQSTVQDTGFEWLRLKVNKIPEECDLSHTI